MKNYAPIARKNSPSIISEKMMRTTFINERVNLSWHING